MNKFYIESLYKTAISKLFTKRENGTFIRERTIDDFYNPDFRLEVALKLSTIGNSWDERKWALEIALGDRLENFENFLQLFQIYQKHQKDLINLYLDNGFNKEKVSSIIDDLMPENSLNKINLTEQSIFFDANPELLQKEYLNNFRLNFVGGTYRMYTPNEKKLNEIIHETMKNLHSKKRLNQNSNEFFNEIDKATLFSDIDLIQIEKLNSNGTPNSVINEIIIPVYTILRKEYRHYDLVQ